MADLELIFLLLAAAAALQVLAQRFGIPQPALLVLGGAALALVPGLPRPALDPNVIFLIFVPPLLYFASTRAPLRELTQQFWPIFHLSVPLALITMVAVAVAVMRPLRTPAALTVVLGERRRWTPSPSGEPKDSPAREWPRGSERRTLLPSRGHLSLAATGIDELGGTARCVSGMERTRRQRRSARRWIRYLDGAMTHHRYR